MIDTNRLKSDLVVGIDLGTGSLKVSFMKPDGTSAGHAQAGYPTSTPVPGWTQQNPEDWTRALETAMKTALKENDVDPARIRCIGLCGMAHVPVLLDENDAPTCPSILWNDCRSTDEVERLAQTYGDRIPERTSNKPSCTWTLPQLLWLRKHQPAAISDARTFLTGKDYLVYRLTGTKACDVGSATATLMYDFVNDEWVEEFAGMTSLRPESFPRVFKSGHVIGTTTETAARVGFVSGTPVVLGCLDSVSEMIGTGARKQDECVIRLGTAGAILSLDVDRSYTTGLFTYPFPFGNLAIKQAGTSSCGRSVDWIRSVLSLSSFPTTTVSPGCDGLMFLPFLQGERAPYDNPDLRGGFVGMTTSHRNEHFFQAVLEGVCYSIRDCLISTPMFKHAPTSFRVVGGGVRSPIWMSILANVLGKTLIPMAGADSAWGVAKFAAESIGWRFDEHSLPARKKTESNGVFFPDEKTARHYAGAFERYKKIATFFDSFYRCELDHRPTDERASD